MARTTAPMTVPEDLAGTTVPEVDDDALLEAAAALVSPPRRGPTDSFTLHAPLELLARRALLDHTTAAVRPVARRRLWWVAEATAGRGAPLATSAPGDPATAAEDLARALDVGDPDGADAAVQAMARTAPLGDVAAELTPRVLPALGGAGHGVIALHLARHHARDRGASADLLRGPVRAIATEPAAIRWHRTAAAGPPATPIPDPSGPLWAALADPPSPGDPGSTFILPTVATTEGSGLAEARLAGPTATAPVGDAGRTLLRIAAHAMVQDDPDHAPYGWTHALTLPQGALATIGSGAEPTEALRVAATYLLAFRATLGRVRLDPAWAPDAPTAPARPADVLAHGPTAAAAALWHAEDHARPALRAAVVDAAAVHRDAHLAKYALACLDAGRRDPAAAHLFDAAAAHLAAWWHQVDAA